MDTESLRDLHLLTEIASEPSVTQRRIAQRQGLALGLTNLLIRRLVRKGYVKIVNLQRNRLHYLLTPKGVLEKARLTYEYIEYSLYFYRQVRTFLIRALEAIPPSSGQRVLLYGTGEVAEIACLLLQQKGFQIVDILSCAPSAEATVMNRPVREVSAAQALSFDWVVVASPDGAPAIQELRRLGVAEGKIIAVPLESSPPFPPAAGAADAAPMSATVQ